MKFTLDKWVNLWYNIIVSWKIKKEKAMDFVGFGKISRVAKALECTISEKIDGTNAQIVITGEGNDDLSVAKQDGLYLYTGSRKRYITPADDNFGFAAWAEENAEELFKLGEGRHFGEWYGGKIQRGYDTPHKSFALFNTHRWWDFYQAHLLGKTEQFPACCKVVPLLWKGKFSTTIIDEIMEDLKTLGSRVEEGYMKPEGIMVYMNNTYMKHTFENPEGKWKL